MKLKLASVALAAVIMTGCQNMSQEGKHHHGEGLAPCDIGHDVVNHIHFGFDKHHLDKTGMERADNQAAWLKDNPGAYVVIEGHADPRGTREYNLALGDKRGMAVRNRLIEKGVDPHRMHVVSYGKDNPPVNAKTHADKRVAITKVE